MALRIDTVPNKQAAEKKVSSSYQFQLPGRSRVPSVTDRMFFTEQLALLLETGESLYGALTTIVKQTENIEMQKIVEQVALNVSEGQTFGYALSQHEKVFPSTYVNLIGFRESCSDARA